MKSISAKILAATLVIVLFAIFTTDASAARKNGDEKVSFRKLLKQ